MNVQIIVVEEKQKNTGNECDYNNKGNSRWGEANKMPLMC